MDSPNDIELAQIRATMKKLAEAVDGVEHAVAMTAIECLAVAALAEVGADDDLVDGFCKGVKRGVKNFRAERAKEASRD